MRLPISFEEVAYFNNEYRGDLIVTRGVLYYFPHTNVADVRYGSAIRIDDENAENVFNGLRAVVPGMDALIGLANITIKAAGFTKRVCLPSTNRPRIKSLDLWHSREDNASLQKRLDNYLEQIKNREINMETDGVPKPMRFEAGEVQNLSLGLKLKFDAKSDSHDFRVHLLHRKRLSNALKAAEFLK